VLHQAREVAEAEVDDLDVLILNQADDVARSALLHASTSIWKLEMSPDSGSAA
jgi:hypothetical protein